VAPQILRPKLVEATSEALKGGVLLQAGLLQRVGDKLVPARLQEPHPMASPQKELKQLDLLEALRVQALDIDPALGLPAPVGMIRGAQGKPLTIATWQEGDQPVLIPEVDLIAFITRDSKPLGLYNRTTLPRLTEMKGEPLPVWGPRRLRYNGFPSAGQLARRATHHPKLLDRGAAALARLEMALDAREGVAAQRAVDIGAERVFAHRMPPKDAQSWLLARWSH